MGQTAINKTSSNVKARNVSVTDASRKQIDTTEYNPKIGLDLLIKLLAIAAPAFLMDAEREGINSGNLKALAKRLGVPAVRLFQIIGVPKATAEKKVSTGAVLSGSPGVAAINLIRLLAMAQQIVANSTSPEAKGFDTSKWLGRWIETPQPALGGSKPAEILDTPTGFSSVAKILGAIESGSYQ